MRAFTLIETLMVVVLLALVAATFAPVLGRESVEARIGQTLADLRELDRTARLLAGEQPVRVEVEGLDITVVGLHTSEVLAQRALPDDVVIERAGHGSRDELYYLIAQDGTSDDIEVELREEGSWRVVRRVTIAGLTGAFIEGGAR